MADISKCPSDIPCRLAISCYRRIAPDNQYRQSYMEFPGDESGDSTCWGYWPINYPPKDDPDFLKYKVTADD